MLKKRKKNIDFIFGLNFLKIIVVSAGLHIEIIF